MKVLWICHFSNTEIRKQLNLSRNISEILIRKLLKLSPIVYKDFAQWIPNGIKEFEKFNSIEMHVISPHYGMKKESESFVFNEITYHFFKPEETFVKKIFRNLTKNYENTFTSNRTKIKKIIDELNPDIIHMYGAENPYYSISALDINVLKYPFIVSLQTMMSEDDFKNITIDSDKLYHYRVTIEREILSKVKYIGSSVQNYRNFIWDKINPTAFFFKTYLSIANKVVINTNIEKKYSFVYFAANISKASDIAVEAFAIAYRERPEITLNIVGNTPQPYTKNLKRRILELGIENNVFFSGQLRTHDEVLNQIQFSRYALLPLKVDFISGTIREAMFSGLPVVTTITSGTPSLNKDRLSVLISEQNDYQAIAANMIKLIDSPMLADKLSKNGLITVHERWNNEKDMRELVEVYKYIIDHHRSGINIPTEIASKNPYLKNGQ